MVRIDEVNGHLVESRFYDQNLRQVGWQLMPTPGFQLNGHRCDCRCMTCRPDIYPTTAGAYSCNGACTPINVTGAAWSPWP